MKKNGFYIKLKYSSKIMSHKTSTIKFSFFNLKYCQKINKQTLLGFIKKKKIDVIVYLKFNISKFQKKSQI